MRTHTNQYKLNISTLGRQQSVQLIYASTTLTNEDINSVTYSYKASLLKSIMQQLTIDSNINIPVNTEIRFKHGILVNGSYEYLDYGTFIVTKVEQQKDTKSYLITCYDKMIKSMVEYKDVTFTFPMTVRTYINTICAHLGLTFAQASSTFSNYNKSIPVDVYLDDEGNSLGYTFRDVLDDLAECTGSVICINKNGQLELRQPTNTNDTINEDFLKDTNVNIGKKYGPINSIVLSRSAGSDNVYLRNEASVTQNGLCELKIYDNQIMNDDNRSQYLQGILDNMDGIEYFLTDFESTGVLYYELLDKYTVSIGGNNYNSLMLNDEQLITQGIEENIYAEEPETSVTDYTKADKTDQRINKTNLEVDKQKGQIEALVTHTEQIDQEIQTIVDTTGTAEGKYIHLEDSAEQPLISLELDGETSQETSESPLKPSPDYPSEIKNVETRNLLDYENPSSKSQYCETTIEENTVTMEAISTTGAQATRYDLSGFEATKTYTATCIGKKIVAGTDGNPNIRLAIHGSNDGTSFTNLGNHTISSPVVGQEYNLAKSVTGYSYYRVFVYNNSSTPVTIGEKTEYKNIMLEEGSTATDYVPYDSIAVKVENEDSTQSQTAYFPLHGQKLMEGSYLADDGIHHKRKQVVLDGSSDESWSLSVSGTDHFFYKYRYITDRIAVEGNRTNDLCNRFVSTSISSSNTSEGFYILANGELRIRFGTEMTLADFKTWLSNNPITIEYELAEEEKQDYTTDQQEAWYQLLSLNTYKNVSNITSDAYAKIEYAKDNGLDIYETKDNAKRTYKVTEDKIAQLVVDRNSIKTAVENTKSTLENNYYTKNDADAKAQSIADGVSSDLRNIIQQNKTEIEETADQIALRVSSIETNGVDKVTTSIGYTFDDEGLKINKEGAKTNSKLDEKGFSVKDSSSQDLFYAGYKEDGEYAGQTLVETSNLVVNNFLNVHGAGRFQPYVNPVLGGHGMGCFDIGGVQ